jgi:hypothetical protein
MKPDVLNDEPKTRNITTAALANVDTEPAAHKAVAPEEFPHEDRPPAEKGMDQPFVAAENKTRSVTQKLEGNGARVVDAPGNPSPATTAAGDEDVTPLFSERESKDFFGRWDALQVGFIDEPRHAVEQADSLVAGAMKRLAEVFAEERARLESQWDRGDNVSTEDLRVAMRRYRSFFRRLLSV